MTALRRLALAVLAAALLIVPAAAAAKEVQDARVCGAAGCTPVGGLGDDGFALMPPGQSVPPLSPWYRIRFAIGDGAHAIERFRVLWAPRIDMIAVDAPHPRWFPASRATERLARRITRGVEPFPAGLMPLDLPAPGKVEVVGPVATPRDDGSGGGPPWALIPAIAGAAAAVALAYRSRRAKARAAAAPTMPT